MTKRSDVPVQDKWFVAWPAILCPAVALFCGAGSLTPQFNNADTGDD